MKNSHKLIVIYHSPSSYLGNIILLCWWSFTS